MDSSSEVAGKRNGSTEGRQEDGGWIIVKQGEDAALEGREGGSACDVYVSLLGWFVHGGTLLDEVCGVG